MAPLFRSALTLGVVICAVPFALSQESPEGRRHGFDFRGPILLDVDGDGKDDIFTSKLFTKKVLYPWKGDKGTKVIEEHFITFDLQLSSGRKLKSVFTYRYGYGLTEKQGLTTVDYWVFALIPPEHPTKGKIEVYFYTGDDESDDMYRLRLINGKFKIISHKHSEDGKS